MKIKEGFLLKEVAGNFLVVPIGDNLVDFSAMITINETGAFLWQQLETETTIEALIEKLTTEYNIDKETAEADILEFVEMLKTNKII